MTLDGSCATPEDSRRSSTGFAALEAVTSRAPPSCSAGPTACVARWSTVLRPAARLSRTANLAPE
ncbi:hypothetical protein QJS66_06685 [Kocuria rhizophila]|nr:hypothetical protein QJS66_06685 [Kocuria rhizophila]